MRIFVIGLPKTGTTSMSLGLQRLGFPRYRISAEEYYANIDNFKVPEGHYVYDIAPHHYWYHKRLYPEAKFILTTRNLDSWSLSLLRHMHKKSHDISWQSKMKWAGILGFYEFNETYMKTMHRRYVDQVYQEFKESDNFLDFRTEEHGYKELCKFLGFEEIEEQWPWANETRI